MNKTLLLSLICLFGLSACKTTSKPVAYNSQSNTNVAYAPSYNTNQSSLVAMDFSQGGSASGQSSLQQARVEKPSGVLGNLLGENYAALDSSDMPLAKNAANKVTRTPIGQKVSWSNPKTGNSGTFKTYRDGENESGRYCREIETTINSKQGNKNFFGTACKSSSGSWDMI